LEGQPRAAHNGRNNRQSHIFSHEVLDGAAVVAAGQMRAPSDFRNATPNALYVVGQPPLTPTVSGPQHAVDGIVQAHPVSHRIREDRAKKPHGPACRTLAAVHVRQPMWAGLGFARRFARGDVMHKRLDILSREARDRVASKQRFDVAVNAPAIGRERAGFLGGAPAGDKTPGFGVCQVQHQHRSPAYESGGHALPIVKDTVPFTRRH
jgi:hypothetical protein